MSAHAGLSGLLQLTPTATLAMDEEKLLVMAMIFLTAIVLVTLHTVRKILETRAKEQTKREIAAYVAEGSISPADATRMLEAGTSETEKKIADAVAWGAIKPEKAESLLRTLRSDSANASNARANAPS